jgi:hypothetical protein
MNLPVIDDHPHYLKRLRVQLERLVSRLKEKNTGLVAAEATIRGLVAQSIVGIPINKDDPFDYVNPGMTGILAQPEEEMTLGRSTISSCRKTTHWRAESSASGFPPGCGASVILCGCSTHPERYCRSKSTTAGRVTTDALR